LRARLSDPIDERRRTAIEASRELARAEARREIENVPPGCDAAFGRLGERLGARVNARLQSPST
jgi:hypothetical protein